jgi:hypothetical protein
LLVQKRGDLLLLQKEPDLFLVESKLDLLFVKKEVNADYEVRAEDSLDAHRRRFCRFATGVRIGWFPMRPKMIKYQCGASAEFSKDQIAKITIVSTLNWRLKLPNASDEDQG